MKGLFVNGNCVDAKWMPSLQNSCARLWKAAKALTLKVNTPRPVHFYIFSCHPHSNSPLVPEHLFRLAEVAVLLSLTPWLPQELTYTSNRLQICLETMLNVFPPV